MNTYDIAVIGAGAAGSMTAILAGKSNKKVVLIEKNKLLGKKILITGKGRCNLTNTASLDTFIEVFGKSGSFLRSAFFKFFNQDLIDFFESNGLKLKVERQGRVFPDTDRAASVTETLSKILKISKVKILYSAHLLNIVKKDNFFILNIKSHDKIKTKKVILTTGGKSYKETGSTGDGFRIAESMGHKIASLKPALVPIKTKETWVKKVQGLSLRNVRITLIFGKKKVISTIGEMLFTHFGISGPLVLDLSGRIVDMLSEYKKVNMFIDLKPGLTEDKLNQKLINEFKSNKRLKNVMKDMLPQRLIAIALDITKLDSEKEVNQITHKERKSLIDFLKKLPLTIISALSLEEAMVTSGGVSTKEINPRTMESKLVPGLYFAGEIIEGAAKSGGYNLQQAFSTGFLAGEEASKCVR